MILFKAKMDKRGRLTIPLKFLRANGLKESTYVDVRAVSGRNNALKLEFQLNEHKKIDAPF